MSNKILGFQKVLCLGIVFINLRFHISIKASKKERRKKRTRKQKLSFQQGKTRYVNDPDYNNTEKRCTDTTTLDVRFFIDFPLRPDKRKI